MIGAAVMVARIATGEVEDTKGKAPKSGQGPQGWQPQGGERQYAVQSDVYRREYPREPHGAKDRSCFARLSAMGGLHGL
jgi:hypothetical protein